MQAAYARVTYFTQDTEQVYNAAYAQGYNKAYEEIEAEEAEKRAREAKIKKIRERKKRILIYYIKQKLAGLAIAALGVLTILPEHDATGALLMVPMGLWLMVTKEKVMLP